MTKIIGLLGTNKIAPLVPGIRKADHQTTLGKSAAFMESRKTPSPLEPKSLGITWCIGHRVQFIVDQVLTLNPGAGRIPGTLLVSKWVVVKKLSDLETSVRLYLFTSLLMPKDLGKSLNSLVGENA